MLLPAPVRRMLRGLAGGTSALLLAACASGPGIPDTSYFRLPPAVDPVRSTAALDAPLVVDTFLADGVHSDQSLLYSVDPDGERLRTYHYQLWVDPPTRMLQRRLIRALDQSGVAPLVVERLPPSGDQYRLQARIEAFERLRRGDGWVVRVKLEIRIDDNRSALPRLLREYTRELPAEGNGVLDSVHAIGRAVDAIYLELVGDLRSPPAG